MTRTVHQRVLLGMALVCIGVAATLLHVAFTGDAPHVLRRCALYVGCLGNACFAALVWIGTGWWRLAGIGLMAPTMWLVLGANDPGMLLDAQ